MRSWLLVATAQPRRPSGDIDRMTSELDGECGAERTVGDSHARDPVRAIGSDPAFGHVPAVTRRHVPGRRGRKSRPRLVRGGDSDVLDHPPARSSWSARLDAWVQPGVALAQTGRADREQLRLSGSESLEQQAEPFEDRTVVPSVGVADNGGVVAAFRAEIGDEGPARLANPGPSRGSSSMSITVNAGSATSTRTPSRQRATRPSAGRSRVTTRKSAPPAAALRCRTRRALTTAVTRYSCSVRSHSPAAVHPVM